MPKPFRASRGSHASCRWRWRAPFAATIRLSPRRAGLGPIGSSRRSSSSASSTAIDGVIPMGTRLPISSRPAWSGANIASASFTDPDHGRRSCSPRSSPMARPSGATSRDLRGRRAVETRSRTAPTSYTINGLDGTSTDMRDGELRHRRAGRLPRHHVPRSTEPRSRGPGSRGRHVHVGREAERHAGCLTPQPSGCADAIAYSVFDLTGGQDLAWTSRSCSDR